MKNLILVLVRETVAGNSTLVVEFERVIGDASFVDSDKQVLSDGTTNWERFDGDGRGVIPCQIKTKNRCPPRISTKHGTHLPCITILAYKVFKPCSLYGF